MGEKTWGYEFRDHVADVRIRAWGNGFEETLGALTSAIWRYVLGDAEFPANRSWGVSVEGQDIDELVVGFLNEQIYLYDSEGLVPVCVNSLDIKESDGGYRLEAVLEGSSLEEIPFLPKRQVKAATYHELVVRPELVEVTLDV
ncbi:MAG TPA: archease [Firmicutes bacterium]|nr:archease [Candidatus Fermentithermobacillaceae bacterium]